MEDLLQFCTPLIEVAEQLRLNHYTDTTGHLTIGWGHNLSANGISKKVADLILQEDLELAIAECKAKIPFWCALNIARQYVLVNMAFNMGIGGLLSFEKMLKCMEENQFLEAAKMLSNSLEAKQVPNRVFPLIKIMESGHV